MAKFTIHGRTPLIGKVKISGAKNSVLPLMAAALIANGEGVLEEVPDLDDVRTMCTLFRSFGIKVIFDNGKLSINPDNISCNVAPYDPVSKMRASFLVSGSLLAKTGYAKIALPGGCAIGTRPVDLHLKGFSAMGAEITQDHGFVEIKTPQGLKGGKVYLDFPSVGATENILIAASLADGQTIIENAAIEPEIVDLATYLGVMGADIKGAGTDTIRINGVKELFSKNYCVIPDRIEAGTFMTAAAITGGDIMIENVIPDHLKPITAKLREAGVEISEELSSIHVKASEKLTAIDVKTMPYPGFPTDMQAQATALMARAEGTSVVIETVFENRFMHAGELKRMGANIKIDGRSAVIEGTDKLTGAKVRATDLRAGAALVLAGLAADGITEVSDIEHIDRGYEGFDMKLNALGARVERIDET